MKELRKSTKAQVAKTYYGLLETCSKCGCMNYCAVEVSSWYPKEANTQEISDMTAYWRSKA